MTLPGKPNTPGFPTSDGPRVWFLTSAHTPTCISLCRALLQHGDHVVAGVPAADVEQKTERYQDFKNFLEELDTLPLTRISSDQEDNQENGSDEAVKPETEQDTPGTWRDRLKVVALDVRAKGQCQSAIAEAIRHFGRIDVLLCSSSEAVIGTVEEFSQNARTLGLVQDQFETNFFGCINIIKTVLPIMREHKAGHVILLTAITGHLGTPGLSMYCASQWAIEGYCDSLAYEIAPFNIRMTIVQPNMEINILTNRITSTPPMPCYTEENNPAPLFRNILSSLLDKIEGTPEPITGDQLHASEAQSLLAPLDKTLKEALVEETVHALTAIGGHENPPARHIVGFEAIASVKAKLKTVSEELEDFVDCSSAADVAKPDDV